MKNNCTSAPARIVALTLLSLATIFGCTKEESGVLSPESQMTGAVAPAPAPVLSSLARYAGAGYSQSIPVELANTMIGSYHASIGFPAADTAIRSFIFDADTLRAYLLDTSIVTVRFYLAHTPAYAASTPGRAAGLSPGAVTLIIAGLNTADAVVRNNQGGVYDHVIACPPNCHVTSSSLIH